MKRKRRKDPKLSDQMKRRRRRQDEETGDEPGQYEGGGRTISTGSTLLDLAISGGRFREGGIPTGILVEIFGPSGTGKTVFLSQIAGNIQRLGGEVMFHDPEARLDKQFARMFGFEPDDVEYTIPDTVPEIFTSVREWIPENEADTLGVLADSLAALSTDMEMEDKDKMGMRRAKEFSEELRKTCRVITNRDVLMVCSNQVRQNIGAGPWGRKYKSPGGEALGFYASLRLRCRSARKLKVKRTVKGQQHERTVGVRVAVEIHKSSVWKPFRDADVYILYDYGIDDIRGNLRFLKSNTSNKAYQIGDKTLGKTIGKAIRTVEEEGMERELKDKVIDLWNEIEKQFVEKRKPREW